jgi:hemolysin activation/secretion protein
MAFRRGRTAVVARILPVLACQTSLAATPAYAGPADAGPSAQTVDQPQSRFPVLEYRVLGNTTLDPMAIERALYAHLGDGKAFTDVEAARQSLEKLYHESGYSTVFVDIPEQDVGDGVVRLRVTEGRVDRLRITGARFTPNGQIREALPSLTSGTVPNLPAVQSQLTALNRVSPDRSVVPVLKAGRTPGTVDVELKVSDRVPVHGSVEFSDRYTSNTSKYRLNTSLSYTNLFQRQHSLSLQYQTAPQNREDVEAYVASYAWRMARWPNTTIALYGLRSKSDIAALGDIAVIGDGTVVGARAIRSLPGIGELSHSLTLGVDFKDFLEDIQLDATESLRTPIRYFNWSLAYAGSRRGSHASTSFSLGVNFGLRGLGNDTEEFAEKRFRGSPGYIYLRGSLQQLRNLPLGLQIFGRASGQISQGPLVSNEQLSIGGAESIRGYLESTSLGDYGLSGTLELRHGWLALPLRVAHDAAYVFAFFDMGGVVIHDPLPAQTAQFDLASWGFGVRIGGWHGADLAVDWARVLETSGQIERGAQRTHLNLRYAF